MTEQHWLPLKIPSNKAKVHFFSGRLSARRWFFDTQAIFSRNGVETCVIGVKKAWIGQEYRAHLQKNCPSLTGKSFSPIYSTGVEVIWPRKQIQVILNYGYAQPGIFSTDLAHK